MPGRCGLTLAGPGLHVELQGLELCGFEFRVWGLRMDIMMFMPGRGIRTYSYLTHNLRVLSPMKLYGEFSRSFGCDLQILLTPERC